MQRRLAVTRHSPQVLHLQDENSNSSDNRGEDGTKEWICRHLGHTRGRTAVHSCLLTPFIVSFSIIKKSWKNFIFIIIFLLKKRHIGKQKVKLLTFSFFFFFCKVTWGPVDLWSCWKARPERKRKERQVCPPGQETMQREKGNAGSNYLTFRNPLHLLISMGGFLSGDPFNTLKGRPLLGSSPLSEQDELRL